jgi:hypothetical protein
MLDKLEQAYTVDLLARITESIEIYLEDDRWDGIEALYAEIEESNKLVRNYHKRIDKQHKLDCPAVDGFGCRCDDSNHELECGK